MIFVIVTIFLGIILITYLLVKSKIKSLAYTTLFTIIILAGLAFYGIDRLEELDLKNLKLRLREFQNIKENVYAAKKDIGEMAKDIIKISYILANGSSRYGGMPEEHLKEINKIKDNLFKRFSLSSEETNKIEQEAKRIVEQLDAKIQKRIKNK